MIKEKELDQFKKIIQDFFEKTGFIVEVKILPIEDKTISVKVRTEEPKILIGQNGQTLTDIQRLLKVLLSRQIQEQFYIDLDINDYKKKKIEYLKETARNAAEEVALTKKEKVLAPMPAYERRVIHLELAERENITTQSIGREPERRVVIRPYP